MHAKKPDPWVFVAIVVLLYIIMMWAVKILVEAHWGREL